MVKKKLSQSPFQVEQKLSEIEEKFHNYEFPRVSVIIPTYNSASTITLTIEKSLEQDYPDLEIIVVDAGSTDRTLEIVQGFRDEKIHIYSVSGFHRYEMLNKGIIQSKGQYLNFLFPGDYYINKDVLKFMMGTALEHNKPNMVFCGSLFRDAKSEVKVNFSPLSIRMLRLGQQPTNIQSCWFHEETFHQIGKFNTSFACRGGFDLFCRFVLKGNLSSVSVKRIMVDYDLRALEPDKIVTYFSETFSIINLNFGFWSGVYWIFTQKEWLRFVKMCWRRVKAAFGVPIMPD